MGKSFDMANYEKKELISLIELWNGNRLDLFTVEGPNLVSGQLRVLSSRSNIFVFYFSPDQNLF